MRKAELDEDVDCLRDGLRLMAQQLMEVEVAQPVGAERSTSGPLTVVVTAAAIAIAIGTVVSGVSNCEFRVSAVSSL